MPDSTIGLHHSARLTYRAVEPDEDEAFFLTIDQDSVAFHNSSGSLPVPPGKRSTKEGIKWITEEPLVSAVICLPATEATGKPIPIGYIHVGDKNPADRRHHRRGDIGLGLAKEYRSQGYGGEAIRWILHFAFLYAGFHRVGIGAFEYGLTATCASMLVAGLTVVIDTTKAPSACTKNLASSVKV